MARQRQRANRAAVRAKSERAKAGRFTQWLTPEDESYHPIGCCDCGLVHIFQFGRLPNGALAYRAKRAVALTKARRTYMQRKRAR
jgi:hypothetical protein